MLINDYLKYLFTCPEFFIMENVDLLINNKDYILSSKWKNMTVYIQWSPRRGWIRCTNCTLGTMIQLWSGDWKLNEDEYLINISPIPGSLNIKWGFVYNKTTGKFCKKELKKSWKFYKQQADDLKQPVEKENPKKIGFWQFPLLLRDLRRQQS